MLTLHPSTWKTLASKCKLKDNGLEKALTAYDQLQDDAHDECLKTIALVTQLANALKKEKEVKAAAQAFKYLSELTGAADLERHDLTKAKAAAEKAQAAANAPQVAAHNGKADAKKDDQGAAAQDEGKADYKANLLAAFQKVKAAKDQVYEFIVCDAKPHCGLIIAKKITAHHKQELTQITGGGKRFLKPGTCAFENGHFVFSMEETASGLARKLQDSVKNFTGRKFPIMVGTETVGGEESNGAGGVPGLAEGVETPGTSTRDSEAAPEKAFALTGSVGRRGKNRAADVIAVQKALNIRISANLKIDGQCGPKTLAAILAFQKAMGQSAPDGLVEVGRGTARALSSTAKMGPPPTPPRPLPPPKLGKPTLGKAPEVWHGTRHILDTNIAELKRGIRAEYAHEHPDLFAEIDEKLKHLDGILEKLDTRLAISLAKAEGAPGGAARAAELKTSKAILADYIKFVKSEPLIANIDRNPFGVDTNLKKVLVDSLTHLAQAIGE